MERIERPQFIHLDLKGRDFSNMDLSIVIFRGCDLRGADFSGTNLNSAEFLYCDLRGTNFSRAYNMENVDLTGSVDRTKPCKTSQELEDNNAWATKALLEEKEAYYKLHD